MSFVVIIPAQETNRYHELGDLAPFGDTTLLEWKIWQCKDFLSAGDIYISSESSSIQRVAEKEEVNFINRPLGLNYHDMVSLTLDSVPCVDDLVWVNSTSPFMGEELSFCLKKYRESQKMSLISVEKRKEYIFYKNEMLNFSKEFVSRQDIEPIYVMTNGCYVINREQAIRNGSLVLPETDFFEVDALAALEIKDVIDYSVARDLISIYFKKQLDE